jgi:hypothetical protein
LGVPIETPPAGTSKTRGVTETPRPSPDGSIGSTLAILLGRSVISIGLA